MKITYAVVAALLLVALFQPWSYDRRGFADVSVAVAGGELALSLDHHAGGKSYCLFSTFKTTDEPGERVAIAIDRIETPSAQQIGAHVEKSGTTFRIEGLSTPLSYFEGPGVRKVVFPIDEPVTVKGSIQYKGIDHPFEASMKLQHWEKSRKVIRFCV
jgi:hypothetical protein